MKLNNHEKEYMVRVNRPLTEEFLERMRNGVEILDTVTKPCTVEKTGSYTFRIILTQGLNRQIRRMCDALGYRVVSLKRVRIMNIRLGDLPTGSYREVTGKEWEELNRLLAGSSNRPGGAEKSGSVSGAIRREQPGGRSCRSVRQSSRRETSGGADRAGSVPPRGAGRRSPQDGPETVIPPVGAGRVLRKDVRRGETDFPDADAPL